MKILLSILILFAALSEQGCMVPLKPLAKTNRMALPSSPEAAKNSISTPSLVSAIPSAEPIAFVPSLKTGELTELVRYQSTDMELNLTLPYYFDSVPEPPSNKWMGRLELGDLLANVKEDHTHFYSRENLPILTGALGLGALLANTDLDQNILEHIRDEFAFSKNDEYREFVEEYRFFGEGYFLVPVYVGSAIIGKRILADRPLAKNIGTWGDRSYRAVLVGAAPLLISQYLLGGSRPGETPEGSEWQFSGDSNAVSGHSFMGAIPFLTAAHMTEDPLKKGTLFLLSTLPALSRTTENGHYPSQAILGWTLAYVATRSVARTGNSNLSVYPTITESGVGIGFSIKR